MKQRHMCDVVALVKQMTPAGNEQIVIVVSIPEQRAHVYRNGVRIGVSTGMDGHPTPTGTFEILQK